MIFFACGLVFFFVEGFFGGEVLWIQVLGQYSLIGWSESRWWYLRPSADVNWSCHPRSHPPSSWLFSSSLPSHSQCNLWGEQEQVKLWLQRLPLGDRAVVNTWGITGSNLGTSLWMVCRVDSEFLMALPSCLPQATGLEAAFGDGQEFPSVTWCHRLLLMLCSSDVKMLFKKQLS